MHSIQGVLEGPDAPVCVCASKHSPAPFEDAEEEVVSRKARHRRTGIPFTG